MLQRPMTTNLEDLARHRFVYDFSEGQGGLSALSFFGELQNIGSLTEGEQRDAGGLEAAFMAASLANFHNRHRDSRVESLATPTLSKALAVLRNSLQSSSKVIPRNLVLMAILLGLHQVHRFSICAQKRANGSNSRTSVQMNTSSGRGCIIFVDPLIYCKPQQDLV